MLTLKHLNEDTSWLISFTFQGNPFNVLVDPWLKGPQTDFWKAFSTQEHASPSCVAHVADLGVEIHAVVISHEWTDHCHKATLLEVAKNVPVYATDKAASIIRSWKHFTTVHNIPPLSSGQSWTTASINGLPKQLSVSRIASKESDFAYYHACVCIAYQTDAEVGTSKAKCILYTPHGIPWASLETLESNDIAQVSALLHGMHEVTNPKVLGGKLNLGGRNAVRAFHTVRPQLWIGTHDEVKVGRGLVARVLKRRIWTVEEALKEEGLVGKDADFKTLRTGEEVKLE
ncbi:hypothetical protein M408DRAFT_112131 [Serendipita vermifera MAFF 305830]|uniref:Metallo-beta-lactamase domain-containing protein n=1 Tax=Serendipita vermifera MAFF 305830 TaxID=933852 RepID=A0A0C3AP77_SERVB|nr:hypothetical protein M408DRAFT_112131 [Serendipita vermifera MAFF 305830]